MDESLSKKLLDSKLSGGVGGKGVQKCSSIPASPSTVRDKYKGANCAAAARSKSFTKPRPPSGQFYVREFEPAEMESAATVVARNCSFATRTPSGRFYVEPEGEKKMSKKKPAPPPRNAKASVGSRLAHQRTNGAKEQPEWPPPISAAEERGQETPSPQPQVNGHGPKRDKAFLVAQEMMTSERVFVDVLRLLTEDFVEAVKDSDLPDSQLAQILDCLPQLKTLNILLLKDMEERIEKWDEIGRISDVLVRNGPFLKLYASYIKSFSSLTDALEEACRKFPRFSEAVKQFQMSNRCKSLGVNHYMLKPVQRIPQYKLLLLDYLKCLQESSPDYKATQEALVIVSEVADHANETIKQMEKFEKLMEIQSRLAGGFQVIAPSRSFIKEGELLKLCRKGMQARWFFLFSDCLLHCSMTTMGLFRIHHELSLSSMKVNIPTQEDYRNEFSIISVARSFTLSASSPEVRDEWVECLNLAIDNMSARLGTFLNAKIQMNCPNESLGDDCLGKKAPVWIPDSRVTLCPLCTREFSLTFRRHHCRACGKVVCAVCSANQAPLQYQKNDPMRVCDVCYTILLNDIDRQLKAEQPDRPLDAPSLQAIRDQFKKSNVGSPNTKKPDLSKVLIEVCATDADSSMRGYLHTRTKKTWKKHWYVVKNKVLYAYKASEDAAALSSTPLLGFNVLTYNEDQEGIQALLCFGLEHTGHPLMLFYAESVKLTERWLEAVREATIL